MGRYVRRTVPATTNNITRSIMAFLALNGHAPARINTQGQWDEEKQLWRKSGSTEGVGDVICCLKPKGRMLVVEVKRGTDRLRKGQKAYRDAIQAAGGLWYEAKTADGFEEYYLTEILPTL